MRKVIFKKQRRFFLLLLFMLFNTYMIVAQERIISGLVTDENSIPIPGANVVIKGRFMIRGQMI